MSMLSTQVDKLRELAARYEELQVGAVKSVAVPSNMGSILRDAADTIWELRGSVNREWAEADRLREQLAKARDPQRIGGTADPESFVYAIEQLREFRWQHATNDEEAIPYINNVADAHERENAKLREDMEDLEGYDQMLRDRLRQETELQVKAEAENAKLRVELDAAKHDLSVFSREIVASKAENAKLRELMYEHAHVYSIQNMTEDELRITATNVMEDNAKLKELVSDLWTHCPADRYYCALCEYGNDDGSECKLADRMRELGVEV